MIRKVAPRYGINVTFAVTPRARPLPFNSYPPRVDPADLDGAGSHDVDRKILTRLDHEVRRRLFGVAFGLIRLQEDHRVALGRHGSNRLGRIGDVPAGRKAELEIHVGLQEAVFVEDATFRARADGQPLQPAQVGGSWCRRGSGTFFRRISCERAALTAARSPAPGWVSMNRDCRTVPMRIRSSWASCRMKVDIPMGS